MLFNFLFLLLVPAGLILPTRWLLRVWLEERAVSTPLGITGLVCHFLLIAYLATRMDVWLLSYCGIILFTIALNSTVGPRSEWSQRSRMTKEEIEKLTQKLERFPENAAIHSALAKLYADCCRYDEAIEEYQLAIKLDPDRSGTEKWRLKQVVRDKEAWERRFKKRDQRSAEKKIDR